MSDPQAFIPPVPPRRTSRGRKRRTMSLTRFAVSLAEAAANKTDSLPIIETFARQWNDQGGPVIAALMNAVAKGDAAVRNSAVSQLFAHWSERSEAFDRILHGD